jgi:hypothetical protein
VVEPLRSLLGLVPLSLALPWQYLGWGLLATFILVEWAKWVFVARKGA